MGYGGFPPALMLRIPVIISVSWEYPRSGPSARQENVGVVHFFLSVMTSSFQPAHGYSPFLLIKSLGYGRLSFLGCSILQQLVITHRCKPVPRLRGKRGNVPADKCNQLGLLLPCPLTIVCQELACIHLRDPRSVLGRKTAEIQPKTRSKGVSFLYGPLPVPLYQLVIRQGQQMGSILFRELINLFPDFTRGQSSPVGQGILHKSVRIESGNGVLVLCGKVPIREKSVNGFLLEAPPLLKQKVRGSFIVHGQNFNDFYDALQVARVIVMNPYDGFIRILILDNAFDRDAFLDTLHETQDWHLSDGRLLHKRPPVVYDLLEVGTFRVGVGIEPGVSVPWENTLW